MVLDPLYLQEWSLILFSYNNGPLSSIFSRIALNPLYLHNYAPLSFISARILNHPDPDSE